MKRLALLPFLAFALVFPSCEKKAETTAAPTAAATPKAEGHVLARKNGLPAAGTTRTEVTATEMKDAVMNVKAAGQDVKGTMSRRDNANEVTEGLAPGKARRTLASKTTEQRMIIMGQEQPGPDEADPLQGVPVIIEHKDGAWTATLETGSATKEQESALAEIVRDLENDSDFALYGDAARKPGEQWDVDLKTLGVFGSAEKLSGTFRVEFIEVKDFQGISCAVLKSIYDLTGSTVVKDEEPSMGITLKGETTVYRSLADLDDVEATMTGTVRLEGSPTPEVKMVIEGPMTLTTKATIEKK